MYIRKYNENIVVIIIIPSVSGSRQHISIHIQSTIIMVNMRNAHELCNSTSKLGGCALAQGVSHCPFILDTQISSGTNPCQSVVNKV